MYPSEPDPIRGELRLVKHTAPAAAYLDRPEPEVELEPDAGSGHCQLSGAYRPTTPPYEPTPPAYVYHPSSPTYRPTTPAYESKER